MPPISLKKVAIALLVIIALSRLDKLLALAAVIWQGIYDSFEPLRNSPPVARQSIVVLVLALVYITIFKLIFRKIK